MAGLSQEYRNIIKNHPLTILVDRLRGALQEAEKNKSRGEGAAYSLPSRINDGDVASNLAQLFERLRKVKGNYQPLVHLVIQRPPTESQNAETWKFDVWKAVFTLIETIPRRTTPPASLPPSFDGTPVKSTSSSQKGSEHTPELVNPRIFEEIRGCTFRDVEGFFDKLFTLKRRIGAAKQMPSVERVLASDSNGSWAQFPDPPTQDDVLAWWFRLQEDLLAESRSAHYTTASKRILPLASSKIQGGDQDQRHPAADGSLRARGLCRPAHPTVRPHVRRLQDQDGGVGVRPLGPLQLGRHRVYANSRRFFQVLVGYPMMSDEELGLDTFIAGDEGGSKSITVKGPRASEETTMGQVKGVAKFSWVSDKRRPEVELLERAGRKNVQGIARIIGHSTTITSIADMRCGLIFDDKRRDFKSAPAISAAHRTLSLGYPSKIIVQETEISGQRDAGVQTIAFHQSTVRDTQQENELAFSVQSAHEPSLFDRNGEEPYDNRVLRCLVISPAGRPICKYKSHLELLMALRDAIKAHRSLYLDGNILHRDISENNIITDPAKADGHSGMLIDLDLTKEVGSARSGARHQTDTMEFMAIEMLLNIDHTYWHDFESFFYVLIWQCARHGWVKDNHSKHSKLRAWYTDNYEDIANAKLGHMSKAENMGFGFILREFPSEFHGALSLCEALRDMLFPYNAKDLIVGTPQDPSRLYDLIIKAYDDTIAEFELGNPTVE
ncbi:hypothetical protein ACJ73_02545 [Blastomyces percursus]|uniref:Fungal-type protein kinase domain-containing protein n=1 Tax=Blastomyces percursus TaxID=1658174 RepID=A0A1J9RDL1_9EURO|nr:hypothetical protein ACJ73_02545 [Blastomyces percursus]